MIGLIAYEEQVSYVRPLPVDRLAAPGSADASWRKSVAAEVGGTGTGYGPDLPSSVIRVPFDRSRNTRTVTIYYDTPANLRRMGVPLDPAWPDPYPWDHRPVPFPGDR